MRLLMTAVLGLAAAGLCLACPPVTTGVQASTYSYSATTYQQALVAVPVQAVYVTPYVQTVQVPVQAAVPCTPCTPATPAPSVPPAAPAQQAPATSYAPVQATIPSYGTTTAVTTSYLAYATAPVLALAPSYGCASQSAVAGYGVSAGALRSVVVDGRGRGLFRGRAAAPRQRVGLFARFRQNRAAVRGVRQARSAGVPASTIILR